MTEEQVGALVREIIWSNFVGDYVRARRLLALFEDASLARSA